MVMFCGGEALEVSAYFSKFGRPVDPNLLVSLSKQSVPISRNTRRKRIKGALKFFHIFFFYHMCKVLLRVTAKTHQVLPSPQSGVKAANIVR